MCRLNSCFAKILTLLLVISVITPLFACTKISDSGNSENQDDNNISSEDTNMYRTDKLLAIVPQPKELNLSGSADKYVVYEVKQTISSDDAEFGEYINVFIKYALKLNDVVLKKESGGIVLKRDTGLEAGQYSIVCSSDGITLSAADNDGITYALATLHQMLFTEDGKLYVPGYTIKDKPDSSYRALMVDLARQWHTVAQVKDYIDLCYLYKIKFIHLHFTDTESFTMPSNAFPNIATVGRSYSKKDIENINKYALERNIEIIPEIDIPGHSRSMTSAYPQLFDHTPKSGHSTDSNVLCIGKPGLMDNLKTIVEEMIEMFPNSRYIHVGGDEANISTWNNCQDCVKYMSDNGIDGVYAMYTKFVKDITDIVLSLGKTPVVWEGFPREGAETISRDIVVTAWESLYHLPNELVEEGFTITNSSWLPLYIVPPTHAHVAGGRWYPEDIFKWNIYTWRNWWDQSAAYKKPIVIEPTDQVIGGTLCAWENNYANDITPVKENLIALSERLWNVNAVVDPEIHIPALERLWKMADLLLDAQA